MKRAPLPNMASPPLPVPNGLVPWHQGNFLHWYHHSTHQSWSLTRPNNAWPNNTQLINLLQHRNMILTHRGRVTHISVGKQTIIGSDNGLSPDRRQAIIWTNDGILLIGPLGTNFSEILIEILTFSSRKCVGKCRLRNGGHFVSASMC